MAYIRFHRGSHQIGGSCTELCCGDERILIDLGSNLPAVDNECRISDAQLISNVFDGTTQYGAILFTHYHGDHYGLYKSIPRDNPLYSDIPMYMGKTAKEILAIVTEYIDYNADVKGGKLIDSLKTYTPNEPLDINGISDIRIIPIEADHSALDAYMFYIEMAGRKILYTGDFRDHGISSEHEVFWESIRSGAIPKDIDILITEGTMLSRKTETKKNIIRTEAELGKTAERIFAEAPYNFVLVSSTNFDTIMELYHNTPDDLAFVCDIYQYKLICKAMQGRMERLEKYRPDKLGDGSLKPIHVFIDRYNPKIGDAIEDNRNNGLYLPIERVSPGDGYDEIDNGFVMLVRPNHYPENGMNRFEEAIDHFSSLSEDKTQIIYSMWKGYLSGDTEDAAITGMLGDHRRRDLHVSGHAYPETILRLVRELNPKMIVPMHTEMADAMKEMEEFSDYKDRITPMTDGADMLDLEKLQVIRRQQDR